MTARVSTYITLAIALCVVVVCAQEPSGCSGTPNNLPIYTGTAITKDMQLVKTVTNGKLYKAGIADDIVYVTHLWGTPFERGLAQGQLLADKLQYVIPGMLKHVEQELEQYIKNLPEPVRNWVAEVGITEALKWTAEFTRKYTPVRFFEEMQGLADGSGLNYEDVLNLHMLPELIKAGCSLFGSTATPDGSLLQLRALDWDNKSPLTSCNAITVYHADNSTADGGHTFANIGWCGFLGAISGVSSSRLAISEKFADNHLGTTSRLGMPFYFVLRDILEYDNSVADATNRMSAAHRTCAIHLGVGDGKSNNFNAYDYCFESLKTYAWNNEPTNSEHPKEIKDVAYFGVHMNCQAQVLQNLAAARNFTVDNTIYLTSVVKTGNTQAVIYDLAKPALDIYVANAGSPNAAGSIDAYARTFNHFEMTDIFAVEQ